jgi:hypothetical protein
MEECRWELFGNDSEDLTWVSAYYSLVSDDTDYWLDFTVALGVCPAPVNRDVLYGSDVDDTIQDVLPERRSPSLSHQRLSCCLVSKRISFVAVLRLLSCTRTFVDGCHTKELDLGL